VPLALASAFFLAGSCSPKLFQRPAATIFGSIQRGIVRWRLQHVRLQHDGLVWLLKTV